MDLSRLYGIQYVRMAPGVAEMLAPYLDCSVNETDELAIALDSWPEAIRPAPLRARDGRLIAGDPVLLRASGDGMIFDTPDGRGVLVPWHDVKELQVLGRAVSRTA
jgi:hypothetical protein